MNARDNDRRLDWILQALQKLAVREYDIGLPSFEHDDDLDVIASGISMVGEELAATSAELEAATARAIDNEKLAAIGELSTSIAHEFSQPMNGILIVAQGLLLDIKRDRLETGVLKEKLESIVSMVSRMTKITDRVRSFTRRTCGTTFESVDINSVVASVAAFCVEQIRYHQVELVRSLSTEPLTVYGDAAGLEQVMLNLLINARHAVASSDRQDKWIEITTRQEDSYAVVSVADNGGGIPARIRDKIFQPFYTTKSPERGTGLGLSISRKIVEQHKGVLSLDTQHNEIARFEMRVPLEANTTPVKGL